MHERLREAVRGKNLKFGKSSNGLDHSALSPVFLDPFRNFLKQHILYELRILKMFGFFVILPPFSWKMSKPKEKKVP